jgi:membrane-associated phospholipid phosphatase
MIGVAPGAVGDPAREEATLTQRVTAEERVLARHRRAFVWSLLLLGACAASLFAVGRHPPELAPVTTVPFIGRFDLSVYHWADDVANTPLTWICKALNFIGSGAVTIPFRIAVTVYLLFRRWWLRATAFAITWAVSEISLTVLKDYFHRGRPLDPLVAIKGYSFPSGHAVAASATAVALVLALMPAGPRRRRWEWLAIGFTFVMAVSRVYLHAHWFSDTVAGVLLGAGIAIFVFAAATEIRDIIFREEGTPIPKDRTAPEAGEPFSGDPARS